MEELVERAKNGDKEAFTTLILSLEKELYKIAKIRLINDEDIFDAIQETIIKAFKSINKLKQAKYFNTWIIRILINKTNDIYNERKNAKVISFEDIKQEQANYEHDSENVDRKLDFNFICNKLNYEDRLIIILFYMEGYSDQEISKMIGLKENTVKTKRARAKQKIKKIIETGG